MLRFFRINDPYRLVFIFLILILIRITQSFFIEETSFYGLKWVLLGEWLGKGFSMYSEAFDYTGPLAALLYKWLDVLFGRGALLHVTCSTMLIIVQAGVFNRVLLKNKAFDENSYLSAFLYMLLAVSIPDFMTLSPQLISLTFVLITLGNVLRRIDNQVTDEIFLNSGIYIGIAAMIYLPAAVFFLVFLFSFILFSTAVVRRLLLYLFGFLLVYALCGLYFYWFDSYQVFVSSFIVEGLFMNVSPLLSTNRFLIVATPFLVIFMLSIVKTWRDVRLNNFQQKVQQVLWLTFGGGVATILLSNEKSGHELVFFLPILSYFWTHYFILLRRKVFKAVMPALLIVGLEVFSIYAYKDLMHPVTAPQVNVYEDGVMTLGEHLEVYQDIEVNSPCFHQTLSEQAFAGMDYYPAASSLYDLITRASPSLIVDEMDLMSKLQYRYPLFGAKYQKIDGNTYRRISN